MAVDPHQAARLAGLLVEKANVDASIAAGPPAPELALLQVHLANCVSELAEARLDPGTKNANRATLLQRASQALTDNDAFLAIATPTQAQAVAQVKALTRQINALIRITLSSLSDVSDT